MSRVVLLLSVLSIFIHNVNSQLASQLKSTVVGGCVDVSKDIFLYCAAVEEECEKVGRVRFKTGIELQALGFAKCTTDKIIIGSCESTGKCAITEDSCDDPADFRSAENSDGCNAEGRLENGSFVPTQYGACKDGTTGDITCVITPEDCTDREAWIPASVVEREQNGGCRCHDVAVGACKDGPYINQMLSTCAISVDDCHPLVQTFGTARNVVDHALLDCRLCPYDENLIGAFNVVPETMSPTRTPIKNIDSAPTNSEKDSMPESVVTVGEQDVVQTSKDVVQTSKSVVQTSKESGMSTFPLTIIIIGSVCVFLLLSAAAFHGFSKRSELKFAPGLPLTLH